MPLYEFYCENCHGIFEEIRQMREASLPAPCPECAREAPRIMSGFTAFTLRDGYPRRIPDKGTYWHMGNIINRCPESETYRRRKAEGRLPSTDHDPVLQRPAPGADQARAQAAHGPRRCSDVAGEADYRTGRRPLPRQMGRQGGRHALR